MSKLSPIVEVYSILRRKGQVKDEEMETGKEKEREVREKVD